MAAARLPARRLPANSQFDRPMAIGRMWFSTQLLDIGTSPSSTKRVTAFRGESHTWDEFDCGGEDGESASYRLSDESVAAAGWREWA